jgi:hypothetical protein
MTPANWRPRITGNAVQDEYNRVVLDYVYQLRDMTVPIAVSTGVTKASQIAIAQITQAITSGTLTGPLTPPAIADTHANRLAHPPAAAGALYFESDRTVLYVAVGVSPIWTYAAGVMSGLASARPGDLAVPDTGFEFFATDRGILSRWDGSKWTYVSGVYSDVFANRPTPTAGETGYRFEANNWGNIVWRWSGTAWIYVSGTYSRTQSQLAALAALLTANDAGLLTDVTDYAHVLRWTGSAWTYADPSDPAGRVEGFLVDPSPTTGWQLCDGTAGVAYLKADGTTATLTVPDLVSAANKAGYLKFGSPASATPNAAVAPTLVMDSYTPAGTNTIPALTMNAYTPAGTNNAPTLTMNSYTPAGTVSAIAATGAAANIVTPVGVGASDAPITHTHPAPTFNGSTATLTGSVAAPTFTGSTATLTGNVTAPIFSGTPAVLTGTISVTAEPRNLELRPWFRV